MADPVTTTALARYFSVTPRAIGDFVKRKVIEPVPRGTGFDLEE